MRFSSPTARKEHRRCAKRYYFRYLHRPVGTEEISQHQARRKLYGIRELGGYIVHRHLGSHIQAVANSEAHWDQERVAAAAVAEFKEVVALSLATEPGLFLGDVQLAETFNGCSGTSLAESLQFWIDSIPTMVENGVRVAIGMELTANSSTRKTTTEQAISWSNDHGDFRGVLDVLYKCPSYVKIIDWKCHSIDDEDIRQVKSYLKAYHYKEHVPADRLYGFAVDLRRQEVIRVSFNPYQVQTRGTASLSRPMKNAVKASDEFAATSHAELCSACPYRSLCPDAAS